MRATRLLLASSCLLIASAAQAEPPQNGRSFEIDVIRPPHGVSALALGRADGALYFGGFQQVIRYDGLSFTVVAQPPLTTGRWITFLEPLASEGVLAIGGDWTSLGAPGADAGRVGVEPWRLLTGTARFEAWPLRKDLVILSTVAVANGIFAGTNHGLIQLDAKGITPARFAMADEPVTALAARGDQVFAATPQGIWASSAKDFVYVRGLPGVRHIAVGSQGRLWAATTNGLYRVTKDAEPLACDMKTVTQPLEINALLTDAQGYVWVGTNQGLYTFDGDGMPERHWGRADGLSDDAILSLFEDDSGAVWAGTRVGGVARIRTPVVSNFGAPEGFSDAVTSTIETCDGAVWTLSEGAVVRALGQNKQIWRIGAQLTGDKLQSISGVGGCLDPRLKRESVPVLVAPARGPLQLILPAGKIRVVPQSTQLTGQIQALAANRNGKGDHIWLVSDAGEALSATLAVDDGRLMIDRRVAPSDGLCKGAIRGISVDAREGLWLAGEGGIGHVAPDGSCECLAPEGLPIANLTSVAFDGERLWAGAREDGGIFLREAPGKPFMQTTSVHGLYCDSILALVPDDKGGIWTACGHGIQWIDSAQMIERAHGGFPIVAAVGFIESDGLRSAFTAPGGWPTASLANDGGFLVATRLGVSRLQPVHKRSDHTFQRGPSLVAVRSNGVAVPPAALLKLSTDHASIEVDIMAATLKSPSRVALAHRLRGRDAGWVASPPGERTLTFSDLTQGTYELEVRASDGDGGWQPRAIHMTIELSTPLRKRAWFLLLLASGAALLLLGMQGIRMRRQRARFSALTAERARVARELHDVLGQTFTGVALQMDAAAQVIDTSPSRAKQYLDRARSMARHAKHDLRHAIWDLRSSELNRRGLSDTLKVLIEEMQQGAPEGLKLHYSAAGPDVVRSALREHELQQITREAIWNAFRHATGATRIDIELTTDRDTIELIIRDDGPGFDVNTSRSTDEGHFGIIGLLERAKRIDAEVTWSKALPHGTIVSVRMSTNPHLARETEA
ncbi:MAG: histidine kinase [Deltaproteobacteria bacterium]|nr:histidine kinase [Deltaproteobacteria bacterium]